MKPLLVSIVWVSSALSALPIAQPDYQLVARWVERFRINQEQIANFGEAEPKARQIYRLNKLHVLGLFHILLELGKREVLVAVGIQQSHVDLTAWLQASKWGLVSYGTENIPQLGDELVQGRVSKAAQEGPYLLSSGLDVKQIFGEVGLFPEPLGGVTRRSPGGWFSFPENRRSVRRIATRGPCEGSQMR